MTGSLNSGWMEGCYQLLKDSRRQGRRRKTTALRSPLIDIQQTVTFCPHYQRGCCHWVMLADTQAPYAAMSTAARLQLLLCACLLLQSALISRTHACVTHMFSLCALNQRCFLQSSALSVLSFANPLAKGMALFSSPSCHVSSQSVGR